MKRLSILALIGLTACTDYYAQCNGDRACIDEVDAWRERNTAMLLGAMSAGYSQAQQWEADYNAQNRLTVQQGGRTTYYRGGTPEAISYGY